MKKSVSKKESLPDILTLDQAGKLLNCHPNTLRNWDNKGILKAIRFGTRGDRRYYRRDIERLLKRKKK